MIDVNKYIKNEYTLNLLTPYKIVKNQIDVEVIVSNILDFKKVPNLIFSDNELKNYFYYKLDEYNIDYNYVNCNSSLERFFNDIHQEGLIIFNNINNCKDENILKIIKNTPGIIIC